MITFGLLILAVAVFMGLSDIAQSLFAIADAIRWRDR